MRRLLPLAIALMAVSFVIVPFVYAQASITGTPLCDGQNGRPAHDPTVWHPLVAYNPDGSVLCTYGHEHGMNPATGDSTFGPLPLAQQISYPWATISSSGVAENGPDFKHRSYKWLTGSNLQCTLHAAPDGSSKMLTAIREEVHSDGNLGATVRYHSYWGEYQITDCASGDQGYLSIGGTMDFAHLMAGGTVVPLSSDPAPSCVLNGDRRAEGLLGGPVQAQSVWYGANSRATIAGQTPTCDDTVGNTPHVSVQLNLGTNNWGPVDPNNPSQFQFYPNVAQHDETQINNDAVTLRFSSFKADSTGHLNFTGHLNNHGVVVPDVPGQPDGQDYIPVVIRNAKSGAYGSHLNGTSALLYNGDVRGPNGQYGYYVQQPSIAPAATATPTATATTPPTVTATATATAVPTDTPTLVPTPTDTPTSVPTDTPAPTVTAVPTDTPTDSPTPTDTPTPTETPTPADAPTVVPG